VALDLATGAERWRFDTIPVDTQKGLPAAFAPFAFGPSGADVWAQPTYDALTGTLYIGTGQNFSPDETGRSTPYADAIIALDARTGKLRWSTQLTQGDVWVTGVANPRADGVFLDQDVGDAVKVYRLPNGRRVVGAGQKNGQYRILDARTGELLKSTRVVEQANGLGGLQTGGALTSDTVYQHGLHRLGEPGNELSFAGRVAALTLDGRPKWNIDIPFSPLVGGLAVANDVLYFVSPIAENPPFQASPEWALVAVEADSGELLTQLTFAGRALGSPAVLGGHVYVGFGNQALTQLGVDPVGGLYSIGLPTHCRADHGAHTDTHALPSHFAKGR